MMQAAIIDQQKLEAFSMRAVADVAAGYTGVMVSLGHTLGLYKALDGAGPMSSKELARRSGCAERYVREWLASQAAAGYVDYHAMSGSYELSTEHALVLRSEEHTSELQSLMRISYAVFCLKKKKKQKKDTRNTTEIDDTQL